MYSNKNADTSNTETDERIKTISWIWVAIETISYTQYGIRASSWTLRTNHGFARLSRNTNWLNYGSPTCLIQIAKHTKANDHKLKMQYPYKHNETCLQNRPWFPHIDARHENKSHRGFVKSAKQA